MTQKLVSFIARGLGDSLEISIEMGSFVGMR